MGLEAMNFMFITKTSDIKKVLNNIDDIRNINKYQYVFEIKNEFWIDLEFLKRNELSIRITLSNDKEKVLSAFFCLLSQLFKEGEAVLFNLHSKMKHNSLSEELKKDIEDTYGKRKPVFISIYGDYTAAIGSDELSRIRAQNEDLLNE